MCHRYIVLFSVIKEHITLIFISCLIWVVCWGWFVCITILDQPLKFLFIWYKCWNLWFFNFTLHYITFIYTNFIVWYISYRNTSSPIFLLLCNLHSFGRPGQPQIFRKAFFMLLVHITFHWMEKVASIPLLPGPNP